MMIVNPGAGRKMLAIMKLDPNCLDMAKMEKTGQARLGHLTPGK
jgi:hypothetical protein